MNVNYGYSKLEDCIHYWQVARHLRTHMVPSVPSVDTPSESQSRLVQIAQNHAVKPDEAERPEVRVLVSMITHEERPGSTVKST